MCELPASGYEKRKQIHELWYYIRVFCRYDGNEDYVAGKHPGLYDYGDSPCRRRRGNGGQNQKQKEEKEKEEEKEEVRILHSLGSLFFAVYDIDLRAGTFRMVTQRGEVGNTLGTEVNYMEGMHVYSRNFVHPECSASFCGGRVPADKKGIRRRTEREWMDTGNCYSF